MNQVTKHRLIGFGGILGVVAFFGLFTFLPFGSQVKIDGQPVPIDDAKGALTGNWDGYWRSTVERVNETMVMTLSTDGAGKVTGTGKMGNTPCGGDGTFRLEAEVKDGKLAAMIFPTNAGCGEIHIAYTLLREADGKLWLDGTFNNIVNGYRGRHVLAAN